MADELYRSDALSELLKQEQLWRDLVDPPSLRIIRQAIDAASSYSTIVGSIERASATVQLQKAFASFNGRTIRDMVSPSIAGTLAEAARAARVYTLAFDATRALTGATGIARLVHLFTVSGGTLGAALRHSQHDGQADKIHVADAAIAKLTVAAAPASFRLGRHTLEAGVDLLQSEYLEAPGEIVTLAPAEVFRALDADVAIAATPASSVDDERQEISHDVSADVDQHLEDLDHSLVEMLAGAREAARSRGRDSTRHTFVSLRELLGHTLRRLTPDARIKSWSRNASDFHNGRPTRRARLLYLYDTITSEPLRKFVETDINAALELFDVLNAGTHAESSGLDHRAVEIVITRAEGALLLILKLAIGRESGA